MSAGPVTALPGWWGKLPGAGDFSHRRLADAALARLDGWLQVELGSLRARHADWQAAYLNAPLWYFALGAGVLTDEPWLGVLMPSVDRVGRYFPLLVVQAAAAAPAGMSPVVWWRNAADAALQALAEDHGPQALEEALAARFSEPDRSDAAVDTTTMPGPGRSHWFNAAGSVAPLACDGWPHGAHFDLLFDLAGLPVSAEPGS